jgi:site-specific DNA recombinase
MEGHVMAEKHSTKPALVPAVAYLRRSSSKQEKSLDEQRKEIEKLARRGGFDVLRWYTETKSGDEQNRPVFRAMLEEVGSPDCDFSAILVYDQGRFSRLDKEAAAPYFLHLQASDITLVSVLEGVVVSPEADDDFVESFRRDIVQYAKNKELKDLAARISRRKTELAMQGIIGGPANYGTRRREDGRLERGPAEEVKVLRWMFDAADAGKTRTAIALDLNNRGVASPTGKRWSVGTVTGILRNRVYVSDKRFCRTHSGNHWHIQGEDLVPVRRRNRGKLTQDPDGGLQPEQSVFVGEPLIPFDLWKRVQDRLDAAQTRKTGRADKRSLPMVGLLYCELCGEKMVSDCHKGAKYSYYRCSGKRNAGHPPKHPDYRIAAEKVHVAILDKVLGDLADERVDYFCREVEKRYRARLAGQKKEQAAVLRRLANLDQQHERVRQNMLYADDPESVPEFSRELARLREERRLLEVEAKAVDSLGAAAASNVARIVQAARDTLLDLRHRLTDPARQRDALHALVESAVCTVSRVKTGKRAKVELSKVLVQLRFGDSAIQPSHLWQLPV